MKNNNKLEIRPVECIDTKTRNNKDVRLLTDQTKPKKMTEEKKNKKQKGTSLERRFIFAQRVRIGENEPATTSP